MKFRKLALFAMALSLPALAAAQPDPKITKLQAEKAALAKVKGGEVLSAEYEHEAGRYIWSLDIKSGKKVREVWVDPNSGKVIKVAAESMAHEKKEKAGEKKPEVISKTKAEEIALRAVPGGKVTEAELEHERGMFIWSLDVKSGKVDKEVWISPQNGKVLKVFTEKPSEAAHEKK